MWRIMQNKDCFPLTYPFQAASLPTTWQGLPQRWDSSFFSCIYALFLTFLFFHYTVSTSLVVYPCHACFHNLLKIKNFFLMYFSRYPSSSLRKQKFSCMNFPIEDFVGNDYINIY